MPSSLRGATRVCRPILSIPSSSASRRLSEGEEGLQAVERCRVGLRRSNAESGDGI